MRRKLSCIVTFLKRHGNKKGSTTIFIAIILGTIIGMTVAFVNLTKEKTEMGRVDGILSLAGRSSLSEYNIPLKREYGIMAMDATPVEVSKRMEFYIKNMDSKLEIKDIVVRPSKYRLTDVNNMQEAIVSYGKFLIANNLMEKEANKTSQREGNRVLKNKSIINMLPSKDIKGVGVSIDEIVEGIKDIDKIFDNTLDDVIVNEYILKMFNNKVCDDGDTFFKNEVEYILSGDYDDSKNFSSVKNKLLIARNIINLGFIYTIPELKNEVIAAAALTGLAAEVAIPIIAEAWALLEASNDIKILENGGKIPVIKTKETWATDIESALKGEEGEYIPNGCETGMTYEDYLRVLLYFTDEETKLLRMMDIMQINIQGKYDRSFLIKTSSFGFNYSVNINGKRYMYDEKY